MKDGSAELGQSQQTDAHREDQQRNAFFSGLLQEAQDIINSFRTGSREGVRKATYNSPSARDFVPQISIANSDGDPYSYGGEARRQQSSPLSSADFTPSANGGDVVRRVSDQQSNLDFDPYAFGGDVGRTTNVPMPKSDFDPYGYGGDVNREQNVPPFDAGRNPQDPPTPQPGSDSGTPAGNQPGQQPGSDNNNPTGDQPDQPSPLPSPDAPAPSGDQQVKMGDRMFTVHSDGSAEYNVNKGDCVWFVATDVLKARTGQTPNNAQIVAEVNEIVVASGLTQNGRNPDLIYPGDKLVIPPARSSN